MPSLTKNVTASANRVKATVTIPVERQILKSACVLDVDAANPPNDAYVVVGLMEDGKSHQHKIAILASGYVGASSMVGWSGSIPVAAGSYVFADIYSSAGGAFRLSVIPWKIIGTKDGLVVVDP